MNWRSRHFVDKHLSHFVFENLLEKALIEQLSKIFYTKLIFWIYLKLLITFHRQRIVHFNVLKYLRLVVQLLYVLREQINQKQVILKDKLHVTWVFLIGQVLYDQLYQVLFGYTDLCQQWNSFIF